MGILLIIAVEIISAAIMVSHKPPNVNSVLGTRLAQSEVVPPDQSVPADNPTPSSDQPQTVVSDTPTPGPTDTSAPVPQESPTQSTNDQTTSSPPASEPSEPFNTNSMENYPDINPAPIETPPPIESPAQTGTPSPSSPSPSPNENVDQASASNQPIIDFSSTQQTAVLDTNQILTTPDSVSEKDAQDVQKEETQLSQNTSPETQAPLVLNLLKDKPAQIDESVKSGDFGSANFAATRMGDFVDRIQEIIKNLPPSQSFLVKKGAANLCKRSDFLLKSAQLMVPESSEQDMEITRGKCLSINL